MRVQCTGAREIPEGFDGLEPVTAACDLTFDVDIAEGDPGLTHTWDVKLDAGGEVSSRHKSVLCPSCGTATFVVEGR